jgi:hypothetical protein
MVPQHRTLLSLLFKVDNYGNYCTMYISLTNSKGNATTQSGGGGGNGSVITLSIGLAHDEHPVLYMPPILSTMFLIIILLMHCTAVYLLRIKICLCLLSYVL